MVPDDPANFFANTTSIAGLLIVVGYVGKQLLEWFRGNKSLENQWKTTAINDAIAGHTVLKNMFDSLKEQIEDLESDLKESKKREAELISKYRSEIAELRRRHIEEINQLQSQIQELRQKLNRRDF